MEIVASEMTLRRGKICECQESMEGIIGNKDQKIDDQSTRNQARGFEYWDFANFLRKWKIEECGFF